MRNSPALDGLHFGLISRVGDTPTKASGGTLELIPSGAYRTAKIGDTRVRAKSLQPFRGTRKAEEVLSSPMLGNDASYLGSALVASGDGRIQS